MHTPISPTPSRSLTATLAATAILLSGLSSCNAFRMCKPTFGCWSRLYSTEIEMSVPNHLLNALTDEQVFHDFPPSFDEETGEISPSSLGHTTTAQERLEAMAESPAANDNLLEAVKRKFDATPPPSNDHNEAFSFQFETTHPPPSNGNHGAVSGDEESPMADLSLQLGTTPEPSNGHNGLVKGEGVASSDSSIQFESLSSHALSNGHNGVIADANAIPKLDLRLHYENVPLSPMNGQQGATTSSLPPPVAGTSPDNSVPTTPTTVASGKSVAKSNNKKPYKATKLTRAPPKHRKSSSEFVGITGASLETDSSISRGSGRKVRASVRETGYDSIGTYIKTVCNHELLNRNEEIVLAREIQILMKWEAIREEVEVKLERRPTYAEWAEAVRPGMAVVEMKKQIRRSLRAKSALTSSNVRLVVHIAKRYQNLGLPLQDLSQEGIIGLNRACEKFDPERGFRFSTYASWWIKQSIIKGIQETGTAIRMPAHVNEELRKMRKARKQLKSASGQDPSLAEVAEFAGLTLKRAKFLQGVNRFGISTDQEIHAQASKGSGAGTGGTRGSVEGSTMTVEDLLSDRGTLSPSQVASNAMLKDDVSRLIRTLNHREQAVIVMRYGLNGDKSQTLEQVGRHFGVTRERIRQVEARALHKLRQPYRNQAVKSYLDGTQ